MRRKKQKPQKKKLFGLTNDMNSFVELSTENRAKFSKQLNIKATKKNSQYFNDDVNYFFRPK